MLLRKITFKKETKKRLNHSPKTTRKKVTQSIIKEKEHVQKMEHGSSFRKFLVNPLVHVEHVLWCFLFFLSPKIEANSSPQVTLVSTRVPTAQFNIHTVDLPHFPGH